MEIWELEERRRCPCFVQSFSRKRLTTCYGLDLSWLLECKNEEDMVPVLKVHSLTGETQ